MSVSLPVLIIDAGDGGGALALVGSLVLAATGMGIHLRGAKKRPGRDNPSAPGNASSSRTRDAHVGTSGADHASDFH
jgi:hypothetical protein